MKRVLLSTALCCLCGCSTMDMARVSSAGLKALQATSVSDEYIEQYVHEYIADLDAQSDIATGNDPYAVRLQRIAGAINNRDGINIKVYKTPDVNAFAVADGNIRVYSGLMDIMTDEEVLGVIGHEIGHIRNKDTKDAFKRALATSALREGIASTGGVVGVLSASQLGALGESLVQSQYSQKQEYEADAYGYEFLKSHGINPWAMALSFEKLHSMQGEYNGGAVIQLFSTHPNIVARTQRMVDRATKDGYAKPGEGGGMTIGTPGISSATSTPAAPTSDKWSY